MRGSALPDNWADIHANATSKLREMESRGEFTDQFFKDWWGWHGSKHLKDPSRGGKTAASIPTTVIGVSKDVTVV